MRVYERAAGGYLRCGCRVLSGPLGEGNIRLAGEFSSRHDLQMRPERHEPGAVAMVDGYVRAPVPLLGCGGIGVVQDLSAVAGEAE